MIRIYPNPFLNNNIDLIVKEGTKIREVLEHPSIRKYYSLIVIVNGEYENNYDRVLGKNDIVILKAVPEGGGNQGKNILRTVAIMAIVVASSYFSGALIGSKLFGSTFAATIAKGVLTSTFATAGMLALNALVPPPTPFRSESYGVKESPTYSISAAKNRLTPYGPIPIVLGKHRIFPPYGAVPYTELIGNDQYLRMLFCEGYGKIIKSNYRFGETDINNFKDIEMESYPGESSDDGSTRLFSTDIYEESLSILLKESDGYSVRTTQPNTKEISVDITFPNGLFELSDDGRKLERTVEVIFEYSEAGQNNWQGFFGGQSFPARQITASDMIWANFDQHQYWEQRQRIIINKITGDLSLLPEMPTPVPVGDPYNLPPVPDWAYPIAILLLQKDYLGNETLTVLDDRPSTGNLDGFEPSLVSGKTVEVAAGTLYSRVFSVTAAKAQTIRKNFKLKVLSGQYDVRLKRYTPDSNSSKVYDVVYWTALRSVQSGQAISEYGMARTGFRIKATEQLNGAIEDFNVIAQTVCLDYVSSSDTWVERATNNPASLFRYVLQGPANKVPLTDDEIDLETLEEWHTFCENNGFAFNHYVDYQTNIDSILKMIASAGRAMPTYVDGKVSVVIDKERNVVVQQFTPKNSWGYRYKKIFTELPNAFRIKFWNENKDYREDELIVYDDGYNETNATKFEELSLPGITNPDQAWKQGRYFLAVAKLRPEIHTFTCDVENLVCTKGDLIILQSDVISVGIGSSRIINVFDDGSNVRKIQLDDLMVMESNKNYVLRVRNLDGSILSIPIKPTEGETDSLIVDGDWPISNKPDIGALCIFGESGIESMELIVKEIHPNNDLTAEIVAVPYSPAIFQADKGEIPEFDSKLSNPIRLSKPEIDQIRSDESILDVMSSYLRVRVEITVKKSSNFLSSYLECQLRKSETDEWFDAIIENRTNNSIIIANVREGETYDFRVRWNHPIYQPSQWSGIRSHTVVGKNNPPSDVRNFGVQVKDRKIVLSWDYNREPDIDYYLIKEGNDWSSGVEIARVKSNTYIDQEPSLGPWWIKAVDVLGNESENPSQATLIYSTIEVRMLSSQVVGNNVLLKWDYIKGSFPLDRFEIRKGNALAESILIGNVDSTFTVVFEQVGGDYTYWIVPYDVVGVMGEYASVVVKVTEPTDFVLKANYDSDFIGTNRYALHRLAKTTEPKYLSGLVTSMIYFDGEKTGIDINTISNLYSNSKVTLEAKIMLTDDMWNHGTIICDGDDQNGIELYIFQNELRLAVRDAGTLYQITYDTTNLEYGREYMISGTVDGINGVLNLYIDGDLVKSNNFAIAMNLTPGTEGTKVGYAGYKSPGLGSSFSNAIGHFRGRIGQIRIWNTEKSQVDIQSLLDLYPQIGELNLVLLLILRGILVNGNKIEDFSGNNNDGTFIYYNSDLDQSRITKMIGPFDMDNYTPSYLSTLFTTVQDMINSGYNYPVNPVDVNGTYEEQFDLGAVIESANVFVELDKVNVGPNDLVISIQLKAKQNIGDAWTTYNNGDMITNFRYLMVSISVNYNADNKSFVVFNSMHLKLRVQEVIDRGSVNVTANPTRVYFNKNFSDVESIIATPRGNAPRYVVVDFNDVPNPTYFDLYLYDYTGTSVTGYVDWMAKGIA